MTLNYKTLPVYKSKLNLQIFNIFKPMISTADNSDNKFYIPVAKLLLQFCIAQYLIVV